MAEAYKVVTCKPTRPVKLHKDETETHHSSATSPVQFPDEANREDIIHRRGGHRFFQQRRRSDEHRITVATKREEVRQGDRHRPIRFRRGEKDAV
ncbi:hypothetical protein YC2023_090181 [Brassica napus]